MRTKYQQAAASLLAALEDVHQRGDHADRVLKERLDAQHDRYLDAITRMFAVLLPRIQTRLPAVCRRRPRRPRRSTSRSGWMIWLWTWRPSIGVALYPEHGSDPDELLQRADIAMYVAKDTMAMVNLGRLLAEQGDAAGAKTAYQQAIDAGDETWARWR